MSVGAGGFSQQSSTLSHVLRDWSKYNEEGVPAMIIKLSSGRHSVYV